MDETIAKLKELGYRVNVVHQFGYPSDLYQLAGKSGRIPNKSDKRRGLWNEQQLRDFAESLPTVEQLTFA